MFPLLFFFCSIQQAVKEFIEIVNKKIDGKTISTPDALKFVLARKLDVPRAVALFEQYVLIRKEEDLDNIEPMSDPLRTELETGKFTILVSIISCTFKVIKMLTGSGNQTNKKCALVKWSLSKLFVRIIFFSSY